MGFPGSSHCKEFACNARDVSSIPELGRSSGKGMATQSSILGESHGQKNLVGYSPGVCKELDTTKWVTL